MNTDIFFLTVMCGTWFDHVKGYIPLHKEEHFLFVKYEDLHKVKYIKVLCVEDFTL